MGQISTKTDKHHTRSRVEVIDFSKFNPKDLSPVTAGVATTITCGVINAEVRQHAVAYSTDEYIEKMYSC